MTDKIHIDWLPCSDGVTSLLEWLWKGIILQAFDRITVLKISLGCTIALLSIPTDTTMILFSSFLVFKQAMINCSRSNPYFTYFNSINEYSLYLEYYSR